MMSRVLLLVLALGQLLLPPLLYASGFEANAAKPPVNVEPNPATPAGYAFAIWGAIFAGCLALAMLGLSRAGRDDLLLNRIERPVAAGFALCWAWLLAARFGPAWATVPIIFAMLVVLGGAYLTVARTRTRLTLVEQFAVAAPLGLYAGWLTAAVFANSGDVLPGYGFNRFGLGAERFGLLLIVCAAATATIMVLLAKPHPAYVFAVLWALIAIAVRNGGLKVPTPVSLTALTAAGALLLLSLGLWIFRRMRVGGMMRNFAVLQRP